MADEFIELEGNEQRGRDHHQVLGPELIEPEAGSLDQLERPVTDRNYGGDPQLVRVQPVKILDDRVQEVAPGIELYRPHHPLREAAEVTSEVGQEVDARTHEE